MKEAEVTFRVIFPTDDQAAVVVQPGEESFDAPPFAVAAQRSSILSSGVRAPAFSVRRDHFCSVLGEHLLIQRVAVISFVSHQSLGRISDEALVVSFGD